jgi:hypothetical protein
MSINALFEPTVLDWDRAAPFVSSPAQVLDVAAGTKTSWRVPVTRRASGEVLAQHVHGAKGTTPWSAATPLKPRSASETSPC